MRCTELPTYFEHIEVALCPAAEPFAVAGHCDVDVDERDLDPLGQRRGLLRGGGEAESDKSDESDSGHEIPFRGCSAVKRRGATFLPACQWMICWAMPTASLERSRTATTMRCGPLPGSSTSSLAVST